MKKTDEGSWLSMLKMELSLIDNSDLKEPKLELGEDDNKDETIVGTASLEARKLWTYSLAMEEKATRSLVDAKYEESVDKREALMKIAAETRAKSDMAHSILFLSLRDQFGIWNPTLGVGIRSGWKVVSFKSKSNPLLDLLRGDL
jgi:hypothetical protein